MKTVLSIDKPVPRSLNDQKFAARPLLERIKHRQFVRGLIASIVIKFIIFSFLLSPACGQTKPEETPGIRLGIVTLWHPLIMYEKYQPFADYLTEKTPYTFALHIRQNYLEIIEGLKTGLVQVAVLGGRTYIKAKREAAILPLLSTLNKNGQPLSQGVFIARKDNPLINALEDIRGTRFAFASRHSTSGGLMPIFWLSSQSKIFLSDLKTYTHLKYHDSVVREVLRGNYDAGAVLDTIAWQYKDAGLKFIGKTDPFPGFVLVVRVDLPDAVVETIQETLLALHYDDPRHRKIMDTWDVNIRFGFAPTSDSAYDAIREAVSYLSEHGPK